MKARTDVEIKRAGRPHNKKAVDEFEESVFDGAVYFSVVTVRGIAGRERTEHTELSAAISTAERLTRTSIYAVNAAGRAVHLSPARYPEWLARWENNRRTGELKVDTMIISPEDSVYLLHWNGRGPVGCRVARFADRNAAETYSNEALPGDRTAHIVQTELDLSNRVLFPGKVLVEIFNAITENDPGVSKFENLEYGRQRVVRELQKRYGSEPLTEAKPEKEIHVPAEVAEKTARKTKSTGAHRGRQPAIADTAKIKVLVKENPKREGTAAHDRFALYRSGMLVSTFIEKGGSRLDIRYDVEKGYIEIES